MGAEALSRKVRRNFTCALIVFTAGISAAPALASPWARADGQLLIISRTEYFRTTLPPDNGDDPPGSFQRIDSNTYVEYGLTGDVTIGGKIIYGKSFLANNAGAQHTSGISELEGYGQYQFLRSERHAASVKLAAVLPARAQSGARNGLQSNDIQLDAAALYGRNLILSPVKIFTAIEAGYRKSLGVHGVKSADQLRTQVTFGVAPASRLLILLEGFSTLSMRNEDIGGADYDIVKIQPSLVYRIGKRWSVQAGVNREVAGRNLILGRTLFLGLWSEF